MTSLKKKKEKKRDGQIATREQGLATAQVVESSVQMLDDSFDRNLMPNVVVARAHQRPVFPCVSMVASARCGESVLDGISMSFKSPVELKRALAFRAVELAVWADLFYESVVDQSGCHLAPQGGASCGKGAERKVDLPQLPESSVEVASSKLCLSLSPCHGKRRLCLDWTMHKRGVELRTLRQITKHVAVILLQETHGGEETLRASIPECCKFHVFSACCQSKNAGCVITLIPKTLWIARSVLIPSPGWRPRSASANH